MSRLAYIFVADGVLHVGVPAGFDEYIELRTGDEVLELARDLIAAGNAHFGTTARLVESAGELNVASYTWADHQAASQATLDEIAAAMGVKR